MALDLAGRRREAERAYEWLVATQHADGSWCNYYIGDGVEDDRRDTNVCAYVATGVWHHYLATGDLGFLEELWPTVQHLPSAARFPEGESLYEMQVLAVRDAAQPPRARVRRKPTAVVEIRRVDDERGPFPAAA